MGSGQGGRASSPGSALLRGSVHRDTFIKEGEGLRLGPASPQFPQDPSQYLSNAMMLQPNDPRDGHLHAAEHGDHLQDLIIERRRCERLKGAETGAVRADLDPNSAGPPCQCQAGPVQAVTHPDKQQRRGEPVTKILKPAAWDQVPGLPLSSCMTLGKPLTVTVPWFPHL